MGRNFLTLKDFNTEEIQTLLWTAMDLKQRIKNGEVNNTDVADFTYVGSSKLNRGSYHIYCTILSNYKISC